MSISGLEAFLIGTFVQSILYGAYLVTLGFCIRWLLYEEGEGWTTRQKLNLPMVTITVLLFLLSTADLGLSLRMLLAYVRGEQLVFVELNAAVSVVESVTMLIADAVLIYRCWIVYAKSWKIIVLPVLAWLGCVATTITIPYYFTAPLVPERRIHPYVDPLLNSTDAFYSFNITTNILATSFILYRILSTARVNGARNFSRLYKVIRVLAESGLLYTVSTVLNLIGSVLALNSDLHVLEAVADPLNFSMAGIAFNLILIRVGQSRAESTDVVQASSGVVAAVGGEDKSVFES